MGLGLPRSRHASSERAKARTSTRFAPSLESDCVSGLVEVVGVVKAATGSATQDPPSGSTVGNTGYGACVQSPASWATYSTGEGVCEYTSSPTLVVCGSTVTAGNGATLNSFMAFGEDSYNTNWRGAGTNGGNSIAIVHMSFGMLTFYPSEWTPVFGGLHIYAGVMVSWGDNEDSVNFGQVIAHGYQANAESSLQQVYVNSISSNNADGGGCAGDGLDNGGFNGCGCQVAMTVGSTSSGAYDAFNENWYGLYTDFGDMNGTGYWYWNAVCNYNPSTYPWSGGDHTVP